jgi:Rod binding domain-containing protein
VSDALSLPVDASKAMMLAQSAPVKTPAYAANAANAKKAASEFEGVLVSQMLGSMFEGISTDGPFGGGEGEAMFRSLMIDEYGKGIAKRGGLGLTNAIVKSLLSHQESRTPAAADAADAGAAMDANAANDPNTQTNASIGSANTTTDQSPRRKNAIVDTKTGLAS